VSVAKASTGVTNAFVDPPRSPSGGGGIPLWVIVLIVVGAIVLIALIIAGIVVGYMLYKRRSTDTTTANREDMQYLLMSEYPGFAGTKSNRSSTFTSGYAGN